MANPLSYITDQYKKRISQTAGAASWIGKNLVRPVVKTAAELPVQMVSSVGAGIQDLRADAKVRGGEAAQAQALREKAGWWKAPAPVPGLGTIKKLSASPGDAERYGTKTAGETMAQAVDIAATTMPFTGVGAFTGVGTRAAAKLAPGASPLLKAVVQRGAQGSADFVSGGITNVAADYAAGKRDSGDLLKSFAVGGATSAGLPLAMEGFVKGTQAVGTKVAGAVSDRLQQLEKDLSVKVADKLTKSLAGKSVDERKAKILGQLVEDSSTKGKGYLAKIKGVASDVKAMYDSADQTKLNLVRTARDLKTWFVDSDAPILAQADKMRRMGFADEAQALEDSVVSKRAARTMGEGQALEFDNQLREITGGDDKIGRGVDDLLETNTRIDTAVRDGNEALAEQLRRESDEVMSTFTPEELAKVQAGAELTVQQSDLKLKRLVDEGLISAEQAAQYKKDNPNYSKIFDMEHVLAKTHGPSIGVSKDLTETGVKMRQEAEKTKNRARIDAREANAIDTMLQEERFAKNNQTRAVVDADAKAGTGNFTPLWTNAQDAERKALIKSLQESGELKAGLLDEAGNLTDQARRTLEKERGILELNKQGVSTRVAEPAADAATASKGVKDRYTAERGAEIAQTQAVQVEKRAAKEVDKARREFDDHVKKTTARLKGEGNITKEEILNMKALRDLRGRGAISQAQYDAFEARLQKLAAERGKSTARIEAANELQKINQEVEQAVKNKFKTVVKEKAGEKRTLLTSLRDQARAKRDEAALTSFNRQPELERLFELNQQKQAAAADSVSVFRNGIQEFYKPNDPQMARFFKGQEQDWGNAWKAVGHMANFTRKWATQINPLFSVKNYIRDQQSRLTNLDLPWTYADMSRSTKAATNLVNGVADPLATRAMKLGGVMGSTDFTRTAADSTSDLANKLIMRKGSNTGIMKKVKDLAEVSEISTRINIMLAAERAGITDEKVIRKMMREATLDFAAGGTFIREMNKGVPFLNAGIQGLRTSLKALAKDPAGFARRQQLLAIYPQILMDGHNKQFSSFDKIAPEDKRLNHIYIIREEKDSEGRTKPIYIKIPKGEGARIFANLSSLLGDETKPWEDKAKLFLNELVAATPLQGELFSTGGSSSSPLPVPVPGGSITSALVGAMFNKDWKGNDIISPNLMDENARLHRNAGTANIVKDLSDAIYDKTGARLSPQMMEYTARTIGSGLGSQIFSATSKGYDALTGKTRGEDTSELAKAANSPIIESFLSDNANARPTTETMANREAQLKLGDVKADAIRRRDEIISTLKKLPTGEARVKFKDEAIKSGAFSEDDFANVKKEVEKKKYSEGIAPSDPQNLKGAKLYNGMKNMNSEEKMAYLRNLDAAGAISKGSIVAYNAYRAVQLIGDVPEKEAKKKLKEMIAKKEVTFDDDFLKFYLEYRKMEGYE